MKSFKQFITENEEPFVAGVFGDGVHDYSVDKLIKHIRTRTPTKVSVSGLIDKNIDTETSEGNFKKNLEDPSDEFTKRVNRANTEFPLLVHERGWIVDGSHRLAKLYRSGESHANVHILTDEDLKHGIITSPEELRKSKKV